jgi:hypothetical protein
MNNTQSFVLTTSVSTTIQITKSNDQHCSSKDLITHIYTISKTKSIKSKLYGSHTYPQLHLWEISVQRINRLSQIIHKFRKPFMLKLNGFVLCKTHVTDFQYLPFSACD